MKKKWLKIPKGQNSLEKTLATDTK
uniref:Uncharacterized protein n=1 Tax=Arundo donax TaxID=35708 RepID=A0A0A9A3L2_ARUDO